MKSYVCWVCMSQFSTSGELQRHETSRGHLELLFLQAVGRDSGPSAERRNEKRNLLAGVDLKAWEDEPLNCFAEDMFQDEDKEENKIDTQPIGLTFCRCILGWRIGSCASCLAQKNIDEEKFRHEIFMNANAEEMIHMGTTKRRLLLGKGLQSFHGDLQDYNLKKLNIGKYRGPVERVLEKVNTVREKITMPDEMKRSRSPLVTSKERSESLAKMFVLGATLPTPAVVINNVKVPPQVEKIRKKISIPVVLPSAEDIARESPLLPSSTRKVPDKHKAQVMSENIQAYVKDVSLRGLSNISDWSKKTLRKIPSSESDGNPKP